MRSRLISPSVSIATSDTSSPVHSGSTRAMASASVRSESAAPDTAKGRRAMTRGTVSLSVTKPRHHGSGRSPNGMGSTPIEASPPDTACSTGLTER